MSRGPALFAPLLDSDAWRRIEGSGRAGRPVVASGLVDGAKALVEALLHRTLDRGLLLLVPDDAALDARRRDLAAFVELAGGDRRSIALFPALDADPYDDIPPHPEVSRQRVVALGRMARGERLLLLAPARVLLEWLPSPEEVRAASRVIRPGDVLSPDALILEALRGGYRRVDVVAARGEISRRGGIVDLFAPDAEEPVRIEFFGDTVESIRSFDTDHQRSTGTLSEAAYGPAVEVPATDEAVARLAHHLERGAARARSEDRPVLPFRERLERLRAEGWLPGFEALAALVATRPSTLVAHLPGSVLVCEEPDRAAEEIARSSHERATAWEQAINHTLPPPGVLWRDPSEAAREASEALVALEELERSETTPAREAVLLPSRRARTFSGRIHELAGKLRDDGAHGVRTICVLRAAGGAERLGEILSEYRLHPALRPERAAPGEELSVRGGLFVTVGGLRHGFDLPDQAISILAEREIFGEEPKGAERKGRATGAFVSDFRDLEPGGLVVHADHGIARYAGLGRPKGGSLNRDFMVLEFQGGDRLFVPVDRLDLVQKYRGVAGQKPSLDKLGGPGWERVKSRVRKSVESLAKDLLALYAERRAAKGHAFSPDGAWQRELEAAFPFELTDDQRRTLREIKEDMESERPMDRLVVGDVGFGKTEVAIRAAFKAIMDGKQVAFLAPTTVLAAQHHQTIRERFAPFPVRVEMLSRFRSAADTRRVLDALERGEVDLVVGTHRLLSGDARFRALGLLIVDEEQRFGVADKERLKRLSLGIDVLSMTATPIPRTLQMSLAGARDLSIIETPPTGRSAIQTYVVPFRKGVVAQAIRHELRRGGQVFFVHNRVETIPPLVRALAEMAPEARVAVAHGRMRERELEAVMLRFVRHEADVLVTTTIIENGLDIPKANTIVVNRADHFGLAQLYQLRGRVGRSEERAYAYFLVPGRHVLTETSRRRLKALQEFQELGSGFRLAAADLEIRGAGEFLGSRQHGHIAALGFDLYVQMLERAVRELKGETVVERTPAAVHLGVDIKIPESYLPDIGDRLALYKRLAAARDESEIDRLEADTEDRSGHLPPSGRNLFAVARLRLLAEAAGVRSIDVADGRMHLRFHERPPVDAGRLVEMVGSRRGSLTPSGMMVLPAPERASQRIRAAREVLEGVLGKGDA